MTFNSSFQKGISTAEVSAEAQNWAQQGVVLCVGRKGVTLQAVINLMQAAALDFCSRDFKDASHVVWAYSYDAALVSQGLGLELGSSLGEEGQLLAYAAADTNTTLLGSATRSGRRKGTPGSSSTGADDGSSRFSSSRGRPPLSRRNNSRGGGRGRALGGQDTKSGSGSGGGSGGGTGDAGRGIGEGVSTSTLQTVAAGDSSPHPQGTIRHVAVRPQLRRKGLGAAMVRLLLHELCTANGGGAERGTETPAASAGGPPMVVTLMSVSTAVAWYSALGFEQGVEGAVLVKGRPAVPFVPT
ncbi:MAG: hypothetical protein WDW36_009211 [Sanguina aurantia]